MKSRIESFLILLVTFGFTLSCAQAPQQIAEKTLVPTENLAKEKAEGSTVLLLSRNGKTEPLGMGFFVDKDKIATGIHVVAQPGPVFAKLSDKEKILSIDGVAAFDVKNNLVILQLSGECKPLSIGDSDAVQIGETVSIAGYLDGKYKTTTGTIDTIQKSDKWFGMKGTISKESSGGPVLNSKGQVIGITVGYGDDSENYAIPSNALKALLAQSGPLEPLVEWRKRETVHAEMHYSRGEQKSAAKKYKNAIVDFDKAISLNPEHVRAYYKRARTKFYINDYAGAIDDCTHAIKLNPEHARAYSGRGVAKSILGESKSDDGNAEKVQYLYQEAIEDFTQAIKIDPEDSRYYINRGISKCELGDIESRRGDAENAKLLNYEGIVDAGKSIQLKYMQDTNASIARIESKRGIASIVSVMCWTGRLFNGSGFFVDTDKIATNIHVVSRPGPVFVKLLNNDNIWEVEEVTAFDIKNDLVVLKISGAGKPLPLGDSDKVQSREPVVAVGYPGGRYKVTTGNVQGIGNNDNLIRTTVETSEGNSGGPLLNNKGEVIGINTTLEKYSIAVPSNILKALLTHSVSPEPLAQWQRRDQIRTYAYFGEGEDRFNAEEYVKAIINFDNAILHNPKYIRAYNWRGRANFHLGQSKAEQGDVAEAQQLYKAAVEDYTQAIKINPEFAIALNNRGAAKFELGQSKANQGNITEAQHLHEAAINDFSLSIKIEPKYTFPYFHRGVARFILGQSKANQGNITEAQQLFQAVIEDCTQAVKIDPEHANAYSNRGAAKFELGQSKANQGNITEAQQLFQAAIEDWTRAIKIAPEYTEAYYNRGAVREALGQHKEAEKDFAKAKELESEK